MSLNAVALAEGETVLISGAAGGVGSLAVQLAPARGATVIATARPGTQTDFVTGLTGAEVHVVDFTGDLQAQVRRIAPDGVDAVLHLAGDGRLPAGESHAGVRRLRREHPGQDRYRLLLTSIASRKEI